MGCDWTKTMRESIRPYAPSDHDLKVEPIKPKIQNSAKIELMIEVPVCIIDEIDFEQLQKHVALGIKKEGDEFFMRNSAACKGKQGPEAAQAANAILRAYDSAKIKLRVLE